MDKHPPHEENMYDAAAREAREKEPLKKLYPITVDLQFGITNGVDTGEATYSFVNHHGLDKGIEEAIPKILEALPEGWRLMTRHEHFTHVVAKRTGRMMAFALPNMEEGCEWHDPDADPGLCDWGRDAENDDDGGA